MLLTQLLEHISYSTKEDISKITVTGVGSDSRKIKVGNVFVALQGRHCSGEEFCLQAQANGAVAVVTTHSVKGLAVPQIFVDDGRKALSCLCAGFWDDPQNKLQMVAITGTNGKTTCCQMLGDILQNDGRKVGLIGTQGVSYSGKTINSGMTTPDPEFLYSVLNDMVKEGIDTVVMEASAHAVFLQKLYPISFSCAIFTNCSQDHLDFFGNQREYAQAKKELFKSAAVGILNYDDPLSREIEKICNDYVYYSADSHTKYRAQELKIGESESKFTLVLGGESEKVTLPVVGKFNVSNAVACACAAKSLGVSTKVIISALQNFHGVEGRMQTVGTFRGGKVLVDFAHTPGALENVLHFARQTCKNKVLLSFGCGGDRDRDKRFKMGVIGGKYADFTVLTSDNPRSEDPYSILSEIEKGYQQTGGEYVVVQDRKKAIEYAMRKMSEGDILLVCGKGADNYQEISGVKYPFSDIDTCVGLIDKLTREG